MKPPTTNITLTIRADDLRVDEVTEVLRIQATRGFNPNEAYIGPTKIGGQIVTVEKRRPSFGVWQWSTEDLLSSPEIEDHAVFLLNHLQKAKAQIKRFIDSPDHIVRLSLWHVGPAGFDLPSGIFAELAGISKNISITCFEVEEVLDESAYPAEP